MSSSSVVFSVGVAAPRRAASPARLAARSRRAACARSRSRSIVLASSASGTDAPSEASAENNAVPAIETPSAAPESPSPAPAPAPAPAPSTPPPLDATDLDAEERAALVRKLLVLSAASSRGQQDTRESRVAMEDCVTELEFLNPTEAPARASDGEWVLLYANVEAFRSSPFFWGFQKMLPGGEDLAARLFQFTAGLPVAGTRGPFGVISQTVSLDSSEMVSEVEMKIFDPFFGLASGVSGTVVSTADVKIAGGAEGAGDTLLVTPRTTRVRNSNAGGALLDQIVVPTSDLMTAVAGGAAVEAEATVTYVDDTLRIMRVGENMDQIFVYTRKGEMN
jgi:hypothetical protein